MKDDARLQALAVFVQHTSDRSLKEYMIQQGCKLMGLRDVKKHTWAYGAQKELDDVAKLTREAK